MACALIRQEPYFVRFATHWAAGRTLPAIAGISITDACNIDCIHCWRKNTGRGHVSFDLAVRTLGKLYAAGSRYLYIQGGEPCTWQDGPHRLAELVLVAKQIGFFHVAICTNGTLPLDAEPDSYSVSVDGLEESHNRIRGPTFGRIMTNIRACRHQNVFVNATFNRVNARDLPGLTELVAATAPLRGLMVNFHIPYPGVESLALSASERAALCAEAITLKRRGLPILNTFAGLRALQRNQWKRPLDLSVVTDCRQFYSCCRARGNERVCGECGYAVWAEASRLGAFDFISVFAGLRRMAGA
jgi:MoaA/NifB/PqqE/SkfB family radical SAM enzyme